MSADRPDLTTYDWLLVNSSAGKDSQAALDETVRQADALGIPRNRIVVVHADLGRVEWSGTRELAERQAAHYGLRFEVVSRGQDLLEQVEARHVKLQADGKADAAPWFSPKVRYCTSDQKRDPIRRVMTKLATEWRSAHPGAGRPCRILNIMGLRAQESPARSKLEPFERDEQASNGRRTVDVWLPIHGWTVEQVAVDAELERSQSAPAPDAAIRAELRAKRPDDSARVDEYVDEGIEQEGLDDFLARPFQERLADFDLYLSLVPAPGEA